MTRDEIQKMSAGREINALIAEKIMGWKKIRREFVEKDGNDELHGFETVLVTPKGREICILDEWENGEKFPFPDDEIDEYLIEWSTDIAAAWEVVERMRGNKEFLNNLDYGDGILTAKEPALSICRAALLAVMEA